MLGVADMSLVSPLALSPSEHVFFHRAEVTPHTSGAFVNDDGDSLPIHDCPWIPASRPWTSRIRLLAKQALARVQPTSQKTPILLVARDEAMEGDAGVSRFLTMSGHTVERVRTGSAACVHAFEEARDLLNREPEVIVLAVDSLIARSDVEAWYAVRYSGFTRPPLPPSEGAAAVRLVRPGRAPLAGTLRALAAGTSEATDDNDVPTDGNALTRVFAELQLPARVPLVVGPFDVDPVRMRDFHLASARHHARIDRAEMPSFEGKIGVFGSAAGLMSVVFALAWIQHGLPLEPGLPRVGLAWARSRNGAVAGVLVGGPTA